MIDSSRHRVNGAGSRVRSSALPNRNGRTGGSSLAANGLHVRGAVVATYVQLDEDAFPGGPFDEKVAVYCDVFIYGSMEGMREGMLRRCLVSQPYGGIHDGHIWKPRAARLDLAGGDVGANTVEPRDLDGDHVLVTFMDDLLTQPVIIRAVPHPRIDAGNEGEDAGHRLKMAVADGEPDFWKHHGSFRGVDDKGNFVVNTTRANGGELNADGEETPKDDGAHGDQTFRVNSKAKFTIIGEDPDGANPKYELVIEDNVVTLKLQDDETLVLQNNLGATTMKVGDGAKHVAIVEALEILYGSLKTAIETHIHVTTATILVGPVGIISPTTTPIPAWDSAINSSKVSIPDG